MESRIQLCAIWLLVIEMLDSDSHSLVEYFFSFFIEVCANMYPAPEKVWEGNYKFHKLTPVQ